MKTLIALAASAALIGCVTRGVSVVQTGPRGLVPEAGAVTRGRHVEYRAPVTIENAQVLDGAHYQELRAHFLLPLQLGPWRYVIDGITMDADSDQDREWTLLVALDSGARIRVDDFGVWDEGTKSHFRAGYRRLMRGLEQARVEDPSLDRYVRFWTSKRHKARVSDVARSSTATE